MTNSTWDKREVGVALRKEITKGITTEEILEENLRDSQVLSENYAVLHKGVEKRVWTFTQDVTH